MGIIYTDHALLRMARRGLKIEWIERVVIAPAHKFPDAFDHSIEHCFGLIPELDNRVLPVIVSKEEPKRVVTAYLDRKMRGKL